MPSRRAIAMIAAPMAAWPSMRWANCRRGSSGSVLLSYIIGDRDPRAARALRGGNAVALAQDVEVMAGVPGEHVDERAHRDGVVVGDAALVPRRLVEPPHDAEVDLAQRQQLGD